jgi:hypothetical protein
MNTLERQILDHVQHLSLDEQRKVLEFIESLEKPQPPIYSAQALMKLPLAERERLIALAFEKASNEDFEVFKAYSEENLDDEP